MNETPTGYTRLKDILIGSFIRLPLCHGYIVTHELKETWAKITGLDLLIDNKYITSPDELKHDLNYVIDTDLHRYI